MICVDGNKTENFELNFATFFNEHSNYIAKYKEEMFFCHRLCKNCKNFIYVNLKKVIVETILKKF